MRRSLLLLPPPHSRSLSLRPRVSLPKARAHVRLLGPCFKTGRKRPFRRHPPPRGGSPSVRNELGRDPRGLARTTPASPPKAARTPSGTHLRPPSRTRADRRRGRATPTVLPVAHPVPDASSVRWSRTFSFRRFQALLTPFSGSFSPFLRSTSSLSVSPPYSALDGINHPRWGCNLKQPDSRSGRRRHRLGRDDGKADARLTGLSPSVADRSRSLGPTPPSRRTSPTAGSKTTIRVPTPRGLNRFRARAKPSSFATTEGIPVGFFSSAY